MVYYWSLQPMSSMKLPVLPIEFIPAGEHESQHLPNENERWAKKNYGHFFKTIHRGVAQDQLCFSLQPTTEEANHYRLETHYYIGLDWIETGSSAIVVRPKVNKEGKEVDYLKMLMRVLKHSEAIDLLPQLLEVKWKAPAILIEQKQDQLTPFFVAEFLGLLKTIVRKGLKKSYYRVSRNLHSKVKGKIEVGKTVKHNVLQGQVLKTYCNFEEFGVNYPENRLLKKALGFVKHYLSSSAAFGEYKDFQDLLHYINPAFDPVSEQIELHEIKQLKTNPFYKEYEPALKLAQMILKRFGYSISNTEKKSVPTPPYWIDMSKLFELYVLSLLKDRFYRKVNFDFRTHGNEPDFLLNSREVENGADEVYKMVIDAKYKLKYLDSREHADMRQVSGYARLRKVYEALGIAQGTVIDCLIVYPDIENGSASLSGIDLRKEEIPDYFNIYKVGIRLPLLT